MILNDVVNPICIGFKSPVNFKVQLNDVELNELMDEPRKVAVVEVRLTQLGTHEEVFVIAPLNNVGR